MDEFRETMVVNAERFEIFSSDPLIRQRLEQWLRENRRNGENAPIPENGQPVENYSNASTK